jgi:hypothetical protein
MFPALSTALQMTAIEQVRDYYELPMELWRSFTPVLETLEAT